MWMRLEQNDVQQPDQAILQTPSPPVFLENWWMLFDFCYLSILFWDDQTVFFFLNFGMAFWWQNHWNCCFFLCGKSISHQPPGPGRFTASLQRHAAQWQRDSKNNNNNKQTTNKQQQQQHHLKSKWIWFVDCSHFILKLGGSRSVAMLRFAPREIAPNAPTVFACTTARSVKLLCVKLLLFYKFSVVWCRDIGNEFGVGSTGIHAFWMCKCTCFSLNDLEPQHGLAKKLAIFPTGSFRYPGRKEWFHLDSMRKAKWLSQLSHLWWFISTHVLTYKPFGTAAVSDPKVHNFSAFQFRPIASPFPVSLVMSCTSFEPRCGDTQDVGLRNQN